jgi:hypothetical protein
MGEVRDAKGFEYDVAGSSSLCELPFLARYELRELQIDQARRNEKNCTPKDIPDSLAPPVASVMTMPHMKSNVKQPNGPLELPPVLNR